MPKPDVEADIRKLPFPDEYADEVWAIHVIEHFYAWEVLDVVKEWRRVLKPGGRLVLEMPDLEKVIKHLNDPKAPMAMTMWPLYGDPRYQKPEEVHKWCYNSATMTELLKRAGFQSIECKVAQYHQPARDFRAEAIR